MRPMLLVVVVVVGAIAVGVGGGVAAADDGNETGESFGASVSSFMQASTAEAEGEVDDGMFGAALDRTDDPEERRALVEARQQRLAERAERLENARGSIESDDPAAASVRDRAIAVRVGVGAVALERSVNGTQPVAEDVGADTESLEELRENARQAGGSSVSELARNLTGPPSDVDQSPNAGPPNDDPPNTTDGATNATRESANGQPDDVGPADGNETGPSDDAGPADGNETGPPDDVGPADGNETGAPNGTEAGNGTSVLDDALEGYWTGLLN